MNFESLCGFYDAKNKTMFDDYEGCRCGARWDNYAPYEGEWPQWAKKSYESLKD